MIHTETVTVREVDMFVETIEPIVKAGDIVSLLMDSRQFVIIEVRSQEILWLDYADRNPPEKWMHVHRNAISRLERGGDVWVRGERIEHPISDSDSRHPLYDEWAKFKDSDPNDSSPLTMMFDKWIKG